MAELVRRLPRPNNLTCERCGSPVPVNEPLRQLAGLGEFCSNACAQAAFREAVPYVMHL